MKQTAVCAAIILLTVALIGPQRVHGAPAAIVIRPPDLWSFKVESRRLLADLGYHSDYAFEFYDEEEIRLRAVDDRPEVVEATFRTILDGDPAYALMRLRSDEFPLWVVMNPGSRQAAWMTPLGLRSAELPEAEVDRRVALLHSLLHEARQRLGLRDFQPSVATRIRLDITQVDLLEMVPAEGTILRYEIRGLGTANPVETLVVQVRGQRWTIVCTLSSLTVTIGTGRAQTVRSYPLQRGIQRDGTANTALTLLREARRLFGTAALSPALP